MEWCGAQILTARVELLSKLHGLLKHVLPLGLAAPAKCFFVVVNRQHISHLFTPITKSNGECPDRHPAGKLFILEQAWGCKHYH